MPYIDRDKLNAAMYHEAFEKDSDFQKWDGGCWIRYKLYENVLKSIPTVDVTEVVRCKDCKHRDDDDFCTGRGYPNALVPDDGFCDKGERRGRCRNSA